MAAPRKKCPVCKKGTPLWFVSWADMVTLLFCLFVIIVAYSSTDAAKFREAAGSMKDAFGVQNINKISPILTGYNLIGMNFTQEVKLVELTERVKIMLTPLIDNGQAEAVEEQAGFVFRVGKDALFNPNTSQLTEESEKLLQEMANVLSTIPNMIQIRGFVEPGGEPGEKSGFSWMSGAADAVAVGDYLATKGGIPTSRMEVVSMSAAAPIDSKNVDQKMSSPQRVEIVILRVTPGTDQARQLVDENNP